MVTAAAKTKREKSHRSAVSVVSTLPFLFTTRDFENVMFCVYERNK